MLTCIFLALEGETDGEWWKVGLSHEAPTVLPFAQPKTYRNGICKHRGVLFSHDLGPRESCISMFCKLT